MLVSAEGFLGERSQTKVKHPCSNSKAQARDGELRPPQGESNLSSGNKKDSQYFPHHFAEEGIAPTPKSLLGGMKFLISSDVSSESN